MLVDVEGDVVVDVEDVVVVEVEVEVVVDGATVVGATVVGATVVGGTVVGATVVGGTLGLAATGLVLGSPLGAIVAGGIGLVVLPYVAERAVFGVADFFGELLRGVKKVS